MGSKVRQSSPFWGQKPIFRGYPPIGFKEGRRKGKVIVILKSWLADGALGLSDGFCFSSGIIRVGFACFQRYNQDILAKPFG